MKTVRAAVKRPAARHARGGWSVCPVCLKKIPFTLREQDGKILQEKTCPEHGTFSTVIWAGKLGYDAWRGKASALTAEPPCPDACGLCAAHKRGTCCAVLEVTGRCNLACRFCFADGGRGQDVPAAELHRALDTLGKPGKLLVQLSGGEPTLRDDLPELTAYAKQAGVKFVQINSNGVRLAEEPDYARRLAEAGASFVFMQFDGVDDRVYETLRGRPLLDVKKRAIENCAKVSLGVTLVPTVVPGVNDGQIGDILRFAFSASPAVRGVHFQPVSYFGRTPNGVKDPARYPLDELVYAIETQTDGVIRAENLLPSRCDHPLCGFHGDFVIDADGRPVALSQKAASDACCCATADQNRSFVSRRWQRDAAADDPGKGDLGDLEYFAKRVRSHGFTVTAMAFQDAGNLDFERLMTCSLHVYRDGKLIPFCAAYLTPWNA